MFIVGELDKCLLLDNKMQNRYASVLCDYILNMEDIYDCYD